MAKPNSTFRVNYKGMKGCCELYCRVDKGQELHIEGDTIICDRCKSELICDKGTGDRLRWRWNGK